MSRLPVFKRLDDQKFLSIATYFGNYGQTQRRKVLHQAGRALGIQQRMNQKRRQMESGLQDKQRTF
jgi:hypothetical protein